MAELIVRKLDDAAKQRLAARAARNGRSVEAEARAIIEEAAAGETVPVLRNDEPTFGDFMQARSKALPSQTRNGTGSTPELQKSTPDPE